MLLSIDEAKVAEVLKSSSMPQYKVSKSEVMEPTVGIKNYASALCNVWDYLCCSVARNGGNKGALDRGTP
jgi:hypothetical protein